MAAPVFFLIFFGIMNGGVLLFSANALQHAADVGAAVIATQDESANADQLAVAAMQQAGLNNALLVKVNSITVQEEDPVGGSPSSPESLTPDTSGCSGEPCEQVYTYPVTGSAELGTTGWGCATSSICDWAPDQRVDTQGPGFSGAPDFALLKVSYTFTAVGDFTTFNMSASVVFRLEPQIIS
jgi:hypothetical protein